MNPYAMLNEMQGLPNADQYDAVRIMLAAPDTIRQWSHGEVRNPETINYRSYNKGKACLIWRKESLRSF